MKKISLLIMMGVLVSALVIACSSNGNTPNNGNTSNNDNTQGNAIVIHGAAGDVELDKPALKVVALEWTYAEDLLALGIQPVGMADIAGYDSWVQIEAALGEDVVDVGTRQEPNLEAISALEPDLIIGAKSRHEGMLKEYNSIANTVLFDSYPTDEDFDQYREMETTFREIAKAVAKEDAAETVLAKVHEKYEEAKAIIDGSNLSTKDTVVTQAYSGAQAPEIRVFAKNSMVSVIIEKIGLTNVYDSDQFEFYGFSTFNVEGLTKLEDANYFYVVNDSDNIYENQLKGNAVWENLGFVKDNRMYDLGGDAWLFGGPLSAITLVDRIVDAIQSK